MADSWKVVADTHFHADKTESISMWDWLWTLVRAGLTIGKKTFLKLTENKENSAI